MVIKITEGLIDQFRQWMEEQKLKDNTIGTYSRVMRDFLQQDNNLADYRNESSINKSAINKFCVFIGERILQKPESTPVVLEEDNEEVATEVDNVAFYPSTEDVSEEPEDSEDPWSDFDAETLLEEAGCTT